MSEYLRKIRQQAKMTQEELAQMMNVSRQSVAKWESGDSVPDVLKCSELAKIFDISIEDVVMMFMKKEEVSENKHKRKHVFGKCVIEDNKIIIPDEAMQVFGLKNGSELVLLGDLQQGIAMIPIEKINDFMKAFDEAPTYGGENTYENDN